MRTRKGRLLTALCGVTAALAIGITTTVTAQEGEDPVAPPAGGDVFPGDSYDPEEVGNPAYVPTREDAVSAAATAPADSTLRLVTIPPCRAVDTRSAVAGKLGFNVTRDFDTGPGNLTNQGGPAAGCPVPSWARAIEANFAAVDSDTGQGFGKLWADGTPEPATSVINFPAGNNVATSGSGAVRITGGFLSAEFSRPAHLLVDVVGYYVPAMYGTINFDGGVAAGSSGVDFVLHDATAGGTGIYTVDFAAPVTGCVANVTPTGDQYLSYAFLVGGGENDQIQVDLELSDGAQVNAQFHINVTC